ncbi:glycoside hydrolase family 18 protein, partial [Aminipila sp.]|uniref:glycoside hydrolase family 18 protein n=1 Tax=Aminipila sp. TaxID=2060095 RepID=UPI0028978A3F
MSKYIIPIAALAFLLIIVTIFSNLLMNSTFAARFEKDLPAFSSNTNTKKIVGYYAAWAAYSGYYPDQINAEKLTHINYAFANISWDLRIKLGYPDVDEKNIKLLNSLKQKNSNLKTLISVGGWEWSGKFSDASATDATRTLFAESCVNFITKYGFDGIDL